MIRIAYVIWFFGFVALALFAIAETMFGQLPLGRRLNDFLPRMAVAFVWPLATMTPRGRYLLWRRWR